MTNPRPETPRKTGFAQTLKQLFKKAARALTSKPAPNRRRKTGEGDKGFERFATGAKTRIRRLYGRLSYVSPPWDAMAQQHFWGEYFWANQEAAQQSISEAARPASEAASTDFAPRH